MTFVQLAFDFSTATTPPPTSSQIRLNAAHPYDLVTLLWARPFTTTGIDVRVVLLATPAGATLYLQDKNESARFGRFTTAGAAVDQTDYIEFPVIWTANGETLLNNQAVELAIITEAVLPPTPSGPGLVTLAEAKDHLRLTDTAQDVDVQSKLDAATAIILDFCNTTAYWRDVTATWESATVPRQVRAAILLELGELWRFRGDDAEAPARWDDHDLSPAIIGLLRRTHDPALA